MLENIKGLEFFTNQAEPAAIGVVALGAVEATSNPYGVVSTEHLAIHLFEDPIRDALKTETNATYIGGHSNRSKKAPLRISPAARIVLAEATTEAHAQGRRVSPADIKRALLLQDLESEENDLGIMQSIGLRAIDLLRQMDEPNVPVLPKRTAELVGSLR